MLTSEWNILREQHTGNSIVNPLICLRRFNTVLKGAELKAHIHFRVSRISNILEVLHPELYNVCLPCQLPFI